MIDKDGRQDAISTIDIDAILGDSLRKVVTDVGVRHYETAIRERLVELGWTPPDWRPIDTAPRDGTAVLVLLPYSDRPIQTTARWVEGYLFRVPGCWVLCEAGDHAESADLTYPAPTHWKPLGPNPEGEKQAPP